MFEVICGLVSDDLLQLQAVLTVQIKKMNTAISKIVAIFIFQ